MKYSKDEINQVKLEMMGLKGWLGVRRMEKDQKCPECKRKYKEIGEKIALMTLHGKPNTHLCNDCGRKYIEMGAVDINKLMVNIKVKTENERMEKGVG